MLDVLVEHLEEIGFLWTRRQSMIQSPNHRIGDLSEIDGRIEAHLNGLNVGGANGIELARPLLTEEDSEVVFAASACLLRIGAGKEIIRSLPDIPLPALDGVSDALCFLPIPSLMTELKAAIPTSNLAVASMIAVVLSCAGETEAAESRLDEFQNADDPAVRRRSMQILAWLGD
ncbi:hypothetical protein Poly41_14320 [Novipirellula artificiosorum]|uniref:HEAT repeat protein n=2 Tax=Novipirellula artificiosorum TaxID=2528016 RepID=A0A5C6E0C9_9BACT|nr:hypothetical protein Poly41_14320 [Novipirellula artificiosorum]